MFIFSSGVFVYLFHLHLYYIGRCFFCFGLVVFFSDFRCGPRVYYIAEGIKMAFRKTMSDLESAKSFFLLLRFSVFSFLYFLFYILCVSTKMNVGF